MPFFHPAQPRLAALRRRFDATPVGRRLDEVRPTATWKVVSSVLYSGIIAALVVGVAALVLGVRPSNPDVAQVSSVEVGDCVTVSGDRVTRTGCEGDGFSFAVAEKAAASTACSLPSYARVESAGGVLCVVPKLALGNCYQVKQDSVATTDIRPVDCPTALRSGPSNVIRVIERAVGAPLTCRGSSALNYPAPQRVGYCIAPVN